jgi:hypothetical protein
MKLATISVSWRQQSKKITVRFEVLKMVSRSVNAEIFQDLTPSRLGYQRSEETLLTTWRWRWQIPPKHLYLSTRLLVGQKIISFTIVCQPVLSIVSLSLRYPSWLSVCVTHCECHPVLSIVLVSPCYPLYLSASAIHCLSACAIHCVSQPVLPIVSLGLCYPLCLSTCAIHCVSRPVLTVVSLSLC